MAADFRKPEVLGKTFVDKQHSTVLKIGRDEWSRLDMIDRLRCGNFAAALNLSRVFEREDVKSLNEAVRTYNLHELLKIKGVGVASAYVFMCALEDHDKDPVKWLHQEMPITIGTEIKHARARKTGRKSRPVAKKRKPIDTLDSGSGLILPDEA